MVEHLPDNTNKLECNGGKHLCRILIFKEIQLSCKISKLKNHVVKTLFNLLLEFVFTVNQCHLT